MENLQLPVCGLGLLRFLQLGVMSGKQTQEARYIFTIPALIAFIRVGASGGGCLGRRWYYPLRQKHGGAH